MSVDDKNFHAYFEQKHRLDCWENKKDWYSIQKNFHWFWHFCESHFWMHCSELVWIRYVFLSWKEFLQHRPALPVYADFMNGSLRPGKVISSVQLHYISLLSWWWNTCGTTTKKRSSSILCVTHYKDWLSDNSSTLSMAYRYTVNMSNVSCWNDFKTS